MLHSKFGSESLPQKKKSSSAGFYFLFFFLIAAGAGSFFIFKNYQRIVFHFKKDKYAAIIQGVEEVKTSAPSLAQRVRTAKPTEELLAGLITDNPSDSYLYYLSGKLNYLETVDPVLNDPHQITEFLFLDYIKKMQFPRNISFTKWEKGIAYLRKALLLDLQENDKKEASDILLRMYLAGGSPYWESARDYISDDIKDPFLVNIYKIIFSDSEPDWKVLSDSFGEETITMWTAIYNLKIRNYPLAFFNLKKLMLSDDVTLRNNTYYLMGYLMGEQKNMALKMYFHSMIDFDEFLKRAPWFLEEHNYTLRFMGQSAAASAFLSKYEKMVLDIKEAL